MTEASKQSYCPSEGIQARSGKTPHCSELTSMVSQGLRERARGE
jgi:hypothetical protein